MRVSYGFTKEDLWHYNLSYLGRRTVSGRYFLERSLLVVGLFFCFGTILRLVFGSTGGILRLLMEAAIVGLVCYVLMLSLSR